MNLHDRTLTVLIQHFNSTSWPFDVSESKLRSRSVIVHDEIWPDCDVVEIERHRSTSGTAYTFGLPMSLFQTYYMRYAINRTDSSVQELPERCDEAEPVVDMNALIDEHLSFEKFNLCVEAVDATRYVIRETVCGDKEIITTIDEAKVFALSHADGFVDQFFEDLSMNYPNYDEDNRRCMIERYEKVLSYALKRKAEDAWELFEKRNNDK